MKTTMTRANFLRRATLAAIVCLAGPAAAQSPAAGAAPVLLTVTGKVKSGPVQFDRAALEKIGMVGFETATPWYAGKVKFEGVPLEKLMAEVGATGTKIVAVAANDYSTEVPVSDLAAYGPILALKRDGEYMTVRDKGPLFVVYPFDSNPDLKSQKYYSRSIWQVKSMSVE